jgi:hypothetical protein
LSAFAVLIAFWLVNGYPGYGFWSLGSDLCVVFCLEGALTIEHVLLGCLSVLPLSRMVNEVID